MHQDQHGALAACRLPMRDAREAHARRDVKQTLLARREIRKTPAQQRGHDGHGVRVAQQWMRLERAHLRERLSYSTSPDRRARPVRASDRAIEPAFT
jgi:hypothetical protein